MERGGLTVLVHRAQVSESVRAGKTTALQPMHSGVPWADPADRAVAHRPPGAKS